MGIDGNDGFCLFENGFVHVRKRHERLRYTGKQVSKNVRKILIEE